MRTGSGKRGTWRGRWHRAATSAAVKRAKGAHRTGRPERVGRARTHLEPFRLRCATGDAGCTLM
eukprot:5031563-Prymnesium_polylepis.1